MPRDDSGAITSFNRSNDPSWQIDIPGLAQLLLRFGADGLKRLQLSGVDIHAIGCLLYLGEITPASVAFRSKLQKTRDIQRSKTWWIHEVAQYRSGVNFVVDELLKIRAGENILALFTAIISTLEESSIEVLNLLFDKFGAGMQNTPSIAQLENIRSVCLNLARDMDFKDRLAEFHHWLITQTSHEGATPINYEEAIPSTTTIVDLVGILKDMSTQAMDRRSRLAYYGPCGAAWLMLYAKEILGFSVCLVFRNGDTIPLSGEFSAADVLLFLQASDTTDVFKCLERPSDIITLTSAPRDQSLLLDWQLSCGEGGVDFFALICRWNMKDRQEIGDLIYSISAEYIERRVACRGHGDHPRCNETYHGQNVASMLNVLRQTLHLIGLPDQFTRKTSWRDDHFSHNFVDGTPRAELILRQFSSMLQDTDQSTIHRCGHTRLQPREITTPFSICLRCHLYDVVREIAYFSSSLVFSDWYLAFKKVSHRRLLTGGDSLAQLAYTGFGDLYDSPGSKELHIEGFNETGLVGLANELAAICSDSAYASDLIQSNKHKFLGISIDGTLMVNYRAIEPNLRPGPWLILRDGQFSLHGEQRSLLVASLHHGSSSCGHGENIKNPITPTDLFPRIILSVKASLQRDTIRMQYTVSYESKGDNGGSMRFEMDVPVLNISDGLQVLHVGPSCPHRFEAPLQVSEVRKDDDSDDTGQSKSYFRDSVGNLWQIRDTLQFDALRRSFAVFHLYPAKGNAVAQWASVALAGYLLKRYQTFKHNGLYLQQKACLACTADYTKAHLGTSETYDACIITAGK
ncbi:hypothetical protein EV356DRAFT_502172 [Viridothelium virens]|uniref:Uncharacterized protein n=1 Tax=Viridothelium virens TaxID=1048519 RepID=A0A6A6HM17_VIRVR|nr:hypothetical protein EV356DRAFT_502172 [Viridothelium virens]